MKRNLKIALQIGYFIFKIAILFFAAIIIFFIYMFGAFGMEPNVYFASFAVLVALGLLSIAWLLSWEKLKKVRKGFLFGALAVGLAGVIAISCCLGYNAWLDSIIIIDNSAINTKEYLAFDPNSNIARLEHEASLKFSITDHLPVVDGAAAFFPLYSSFVEAVYPLNIPPLNREDSPYRYNNTISAYYNLCYKKADVIFVFAPDAQQLENADYYGIEYELIPIGWEAFVFFTNSKNSVTDLEEEQIRSIYAGKITDWSEVGGEHGEILPYQRNAGSGSQTALIEFMGDVPLMKPPSELVNSFMWGIIEVVSDYHNHKGAMGFSFYHYAEEIVANPNVRLLSVNGVAPSPETVASGEYPIKMPFYAVVRKGERTDEINRLLDWILGDEGQFLVAGSGYTPIS